MIKGYLETEDLDRAKICEANIRDNMTSVTNEICKVEKPNKKYLLEKLKSIVWDVNVLIRMCEGGNDEESTD